MHGNDVTKPAVLKAGCAVRKAMLGALLVVTLGNLQGRGNVAFSSVDPGEIPAPLTPAATTAIFAHMAIGGGYTTVFTFLNTGADAVSGTLYLTDQKGIPLTANLDGSLSSSLPLNIPPGGTKFVTAGPLNPAEPAAKVGWARVESTGGSLGGVATFQLVQGGALTTIAGVLASNTMTVATIPVDDDIPADRYTGYAIANPGSAEITVSIQTVNAEGTTSAPAAVLSSINLKPGEQKAAFVFQDDKASKTAFRGSVVLTGLNGANFSVVALVQNSGLFTAIPVIPEKAPNIR